MLMDLKLCQVNVLGSNFELFCFLYKRGQLTTSQHLAVDLSALDLS